METIESLTRNKVKKVSNKRPGITTARHVLALREMEVNRGKRIGEALLRAGYSNTIVKNPKRVLQSDGFKKLLYASGLTEQLVADSLTEDIKNKPRKRVEELKLAADILRMRGSSTPASEFTPTKINITQINIAPDAPQGPTAHESHAPIPTEHIDLPTRTESHTEHKNT